MNANFLKYIQRNGAYSLHWLIAVTGVNDDYDRSTVLFANNSEDVELDGHIYRHSCFKFSPNPSESGFDGGGKLEIAARDSDGADNGIFDRIIGFRNTYLDVIGVLDESGTITPARIFSMQHGTITGDREKITFTFDKDDRLNMTFPALIFSHYNNRGN